MVPEYLQSLYYYLEGDSHSPKVKTLISKNQPSPKKEKAAALPVHAPCRAVWLWAGTTLLHADRDPTFCAKGPGMNTGVWARPQSPPHIA